MNINQNVSFRRQNSVNQQKQIKNLSLLEEKKNDLILPKINPNANHSAVNPNQQNRQKIQSANIKKNQQQQPLISIHKQTKCNFCNTKVANLQQHWKVCPKKNVKCNKCQINMPYRLMGSHVCMVSQQNNQKINHQQSESRIRNNKNQIQDYNDNQSYRGFQQRYDNNNSNEEYDYSFNETLYQDQNNATKYNQRRNESKASNKLVPQQQQLQNDSQYFIHPSNQQSKHIINHFGYNSSAILENDDNFITYQNNEFEFTENNFHKRNQQVQVQNGQNQQQQVHNIQRMPKNNREIMNSTHLDQIKQNTNTYQSSQILDCDSLISLDSFYNHRRMSPQIYGHSQNEVEDDIQDEEDTQNENEDNETTQNQEFYDENEQNQEEEYDEQQLYELAHIERWIREQYQQQYLQNLGINQNSHQQQHHQINNRNNILQGVRGIRLLNNNNQINRQQIQNNQIPHNHNNHNRIQDQLSQSYYFEEEQDDQDGCQLRSDQCEQTNSNIYQNEEEEDDDQYYEEYYEQQQDENEENPHQRNYQMRYTYDDQQNMNASDFLIDNFNESSDELNRIISSQFTELNYRMLSNHLEQGNSQNSPLLLSAYPQIQQQIINNILNNPRLSELINPEMLYWEEEEEEEGIPGLEQEEIDRLRITYHKEESQNEKKEGSNISCAICMSDFNVGDELRKLQCDHRFHVDCIDNWLKIKGNCPMCREIQIE